MSYEASVNVFGMDCKYVEWLAYGYLTGVGESIILGRNGDVMEGINNLSDMAAALVKHSG